MCASAFYLSKVVVSSQVLFVFTAGFGTEQCHVAVVFCGRHVTVSSL